MPKKNIVAGVDIGSTKVAVLVGEITSHGYLEILGVGECQASGLRRGVIVDIEHTSRAVQAAAEQAERMSGVQLHTVYAGLTGPHITSMGNRGVVAVSSPDKEISIEDVNRVLDASRVISLPGDKRIIHVLSREFVVDGYDGVVDPVGMSGSRLEVETHIVTASAAAVQNLLKSIQRAGLSVAELVLNPLASAEAVILPAEKELGVALADIGGGTTEIALFDRGGMCFTSVLPVGGEHITSDLAVGLRTPLQYAEKIKRENGCVLASLMPDTADIDVETIGLQQWRKVSRKTVASIIEPRVQEIFALIKHEMKKSGLKGMLPGGVVITGGTALMDGFGNLAYEELSLPVRVGQPLHLGGLADMVSGPQYATVVGLLQYAAKKGTGGAEAGEGPPWENVWLLIRNWVRNILGA
ncbi:MAG: cell division protein FtsA [Bacillota bacterium]